MPQQSPSDHPYKHIWSIDAQPLDLEIIDEKGLPLKHYNLMLVVDELTRMIIDIRREPSTQDEEPNSTQ